jgi:ABC-2 type transport system ATP-binding protein
MRGKELWFFGEEGVSMADRFALEVDDLHVRYGHLHAVCGLSLRLKRGESLALLGANGSGKSSTLSALCGLVQPDSGSIQIDGISLTQNPGLCRSRLGVVPQDFAFYEEMSGRDNLMFVGRLYGLHGTRLRRKVREVLDFVRLADVAHRPAGTLSGGMQRRLNLACSVLHDPVLLLLDEPTVGLDMNSRDAIYQLLESLRDRGCAFILTTHQLHEAEGFCDKVAVLRKGVLIAQGTLAELARQNPQPVKKPLHPELEESRVDSVHHFAHELRGPQGTNLESVLSRILAESNAREVTP